MTWHLKNRELENKLIAIDCEFLDNLNDAVNEKIEEFSPGWMEEGDLITLMFCRDHQIELGELYFLFHELEEVPEYNPHTWNLYPEVTPPQGAMMRIKYHDVTSKDRKVERGFALFDCGQWVSDSGYPKFPNNPQNYVIWFRPWIGPDEEGEE